MANEWLMMAMLMQQQAAAADQRRAADEASTKAQADQQAQAAKDAEAQKQASLAKQRNDQWQKQLSDAQAANAARQQAANARGAPMAPTEAWSPVAGTGYGQTASAPTDRSVGVDGWADAGKSPLGKMFGQAAAPTQRFMPVGSLDFPQSQGGQSSSSTKWQSGAGAPGGAGFRMF